MLFRSNVNSKADYTAIVPTQLHRALNGDTQLLEHLQGCKAVLVGGGALDPELHREAQAKKINIVTTYGMTETSGGVVYNGAPLDGVHIEIRDGVIAIKAPQVALGYLNGEFPVEDGWFITKDRGEFRDGKLAILGRDRKSTRLNSSHVSESRMPSSA